MNYLKFRKLLLYKWHVPRLVQFLDSRYRFGDHLDLLVGGCLLLHLLARVRLRLIPGPLSILSFISCYLVARLGAGFLGVVLDRMEGAAGVVYGGWSDLLHS